MAGLNSKPRVSLSSRQPTPIEQQNITEYVKTVKRYAYNIASKYHTPYDDYDELVSFGMYSLFKHLRVYDYTRGEFKSFLINIYYNMVKFAIEMKNKSTICCAFDEETTAPHNGNTIDTDNVDNKLMVEQVLSLLTENERKIIVDRFFHDRTLEQIGNDFGLSKERIRQKINYIIKRIRSTILSTHSMLPNL
jgi:RNA polymerase sigma factor (sigma-70 family)